MTASGPRKMLLEDEVLSVIPLSRSTLWRMERAGKFPRATYISANRRCWFEDEIIEWQNSVNEFNPHRRRGRERRPKTLKHDHAADKPL